MTNSSPADHERQSWTTVGSRVSPHRQAFDVVSTPEKHPATRESTPNCSRQHGRSCACGSVPFRLILRKPVCDSRPGRGPRGSAEPGSCRCWRPRRDHRENALVLVDAHVEHHRRGRAQHLLDGPPPRWAGHAQPTQAIRLGQLHPIGDAGQVDGAVALLVDDALPTAGPCRALLLMMTVFTGKLSRRSTWPAPGCSSRRSRPQSMLNDLPAGVCGLPRPWPGQPVAHGADPPEVNHARGCVNL